MRLNNEIVTEEPLVDMFRRKATAHIEGEVCPYCEYVNDAESVTCVQCYYELNKAPRDQGEEISDELSNLIFDELMSDDDDSWEEGDALDVVLSLDSDPLQVDQYEATNFSKEEPEKIGFMKSDSPELHETIAHKPVEIEPEDIGEPIKGVEKLDFSNVDPFAEVKEPVHKGRGTVFSPTTPIGLDVDLLGHIGGNELPSLPPDDLYENKIDLATKSPAPTPTSVLPRIPDIIPKNEQMIVKTEPENYSQPERNSESVLPPLPEDVSLETTEPPQKEVTSIWPWKSEESWNPTEIYREVVSALEQANGGDLDAASKTIDNLGPHLTNDNVDMIYHIGVVLKKLNRVDEVKTMLGSANILLPDNEHVISAIAHLGVEI